MKAIIAAGGSGTRLRPLTFSSNKHLLPIANKPLLLYPFEAIVQVGVKEIGVIVNETRSAIESLLGDGSKWGVRVTYIPQEKPLGLGHIVMISREFISGEPFVYILGDNIFTQGIKRPYEAFNTKKPDGLLTMIEHEENFRLGVPYFDQLGNLTKVVEKPQNPPNKYAVPGLYFFNQRVFEAFEGDKAVKPSLRGEYEITDLYSYLLNQGYKVETEMVEGVWMDPGKFDDMLKANRFLLEQNQLNNKDGVIENCELIGEVGVGKNSVLLNSRIEGPVVIGENTLIKEAKIGPYVSIQHECKLVSVSISNSIVMSGTEMTEINDPITDSMLGRSARISSKKTKPINMFVGDHCVIRL